MSTSGFGFPTLTLIVVAGIIGSLVAINPRLRIPVVVGELVVGIIIGRTGFNWIDTSSPTFTMLSNIGFALVMFVSGTHVPVRDKTIVSVLPKAALRTVVVGAVAAVLGALLANAFHTGHALLYAVLIASSSAALVLPIIESLGLTGPAVLTTTAQVAIADTASIVLLPLVIDIKHAPRAAIGAVAVAACAGIVFVILHALERAGQLDRFHHYSKQRQIAGELRVSLAIVFGLAALATQTHVSIMLAGFALGLAVAGVGEPRRLARQLFGFTDGFFSPLFYVGLGASLHVRELGEHPRLALLGLGLGAAAVLAHVSGRLFGQPVALGALASAQLGVPVAAATLGDQQHTLVSGEGSALILGALVTIALSSLGGSWYAGSSTGNRSGDPSVKLPLPPQISSGDSNADQPGAAEPTGDQGSEGAKDAHKD